MNINKKDREELILEEIPQVKYIAQRISKGLPSHVELNDLVSAGIVGLMDAIKKFNPEKGVKFKTYAELRIKGEIVDSLRRLDWAPRDLRKNIRNLEKAELNIRHALGREPSDQELANHLDVSVEKVYKIKLGVKTLEVGSLEGGAGNNKKNDECPGTLKTLDLIKDQDGNDPFLISQKTEFKSLLIQEINNLNKRQRLVLMLYYYDELKMSQIGKILGVNESRISQLHSKAMIVLKRKLYFLKGKHRFTPKKPVSIKPFSERMTACSSF